MLSSAPDNWPRASSSFKLAVPYFGVDTSASNSIGGLKIDFTKLHFVVRAILGISSYKRVTGCFNLRFAGYLFGQIYWKCHSVKFELDSELEQERAQAAILFGIDLSYFAVHLLCQFKFSIFWYLKKTVQTDLSLMFFKAQVFGRRLVLEQQVTDFA